MERRAFSLVEVVFSLAIISLSLVTMMGLMPVGLVSLRHSIDSTTEGEIIKQLTAQIRLTPFSELGTSYPNNTSFFYDDQGSYLTNGPAVTSAPAATRYWVTITQGTPVYPGYNNAPALSPMANSIKMLTLEFISGPNTQAAVLTTNNYVVLVPNSGN